MATATNATTSAATRRLTINGAKKAHSTFFEQSGIRKSKARSQRPFLVVRNMGTGTTDLQIVEDVTEVYNMPKKTRVMTQWEGKKRSDYYTFTVGQLRDYCEANPAKTGEVI